MNNSHESQRRSYDRDASASDKSRYPRGRADSHNRLNDSSNGKQIAVYPTSANPPTWGHADIMSRAAKKFDTLYWVAAINPAKKLDFSLEQRLRMMQAYVDYYKLKNVIVVSHDGAVVRYAKKVGANFLLRGLRNTSDFQAELELASGNRGIDKGIETICLFAKPHFATISSNLIRELARLGERIDQYVLPELVEEIRKTLAPIGSTI